MSDPWREKEKDEERLKGGRAFSLDILFVSFHEIYFWHTEVNMHTPRHSQIPLLGVHPEPLKAGEFCAPKFTAALFTIAKM